MALIPTVRRRWLAPIMVASTVALVLGAGAAAAFESQTVGSFWKGLWWAVSLMTTVGFIGGPPSTLIGALVSTVLMLTGFLLLSLISASLASLFVKEDEAPVLRHELQAEREIISALDDIRQRLARLERASVVGDPQPRADDPPPPPPPLQRE